MSRDDLLNDLDYVKSLAEQGEHAPLVGGRIGLMWGLLICFVFFMQWAILSGTLALPEYSLLFLWLGFAVIGGLGTFILGRQTERKPGANSVANRVETYVWVMFVAMMASLFLGITLNQIISGGTAKLFDIMVIVGFAGQGLAYGVVAAVSRFAWVRYASIASFISSILCFGVYGQHTIYLIGAVAVIFTVVIPSLISLKQEPADVI